MTDRELERRLKDAVAREAPDDLEGVLSRCGSDRGTVLYMPAQRQRTGGWKRGLIAACLALALFAGGGGSVTVINTIGGNVIVNVKESRIAISEQMARKIMV